MAFSRITGAGLSSRSPLPPLWLFDFDRTLAVLEPEVDWTASRQALEIELRAAGVPGELMSELVSLYPRGNLALYEALRARIINDATCSSGARSIIKSASAVIEHHELAGVNRAVPMPGALTLLRNLNRRQIKAVIVTSNSSITARTWLECNRVADTIDGIIGRDSGLSLKPSPAMIERALVLFDQTADKALFVGDSLADLEAARAAGVRFCAIAPDAQARVRMEQAGALDIFPSLDALAAHFGVACEPLLK
jgi:HAD superfamily hydrolase (TIGR01509 family)